MPERTAANGLISPRERCLIAAMAALSIMMGAASAWLSRSEMNPDGISYLDLSDRWMAGDLSGVVSGYWSPLYAAILAVVRLVVHPAAQFEFAAAHVANFVVFLMGLAAVSLFVKEILTRSLAAPWRREAIVLWCYALFLWSSISQITIAFVTPDLLVSAVSWFLALLVLKASDDKLLFSFALGVMSGIGFLSKTIMFPVAIAFLAAGLPRRHYLRAALLSLAGFACIGGPWITALSQQKGRLTFGDTGKLTYALYVDGIAYYTHWHGDPPGSGFPAHPTRRVFEHPAVFEFNGPLRATYPPWFDPSYWNEGMRTHFDLRGQVKALIETTKTYYVLFVKTQWAFAGLAVLLLLTGRRSDSLRDALRIGFPALFALGLYSLIHVEGRYVGGFMALLFIAMLLITDVEKRTLQKVTAIVVISLLVSSSVELIKQYGTRRSLPQQWPMATGLKAAGLRPGDGIASVGTMIVHFWPRLLRVRVVAEVQEESVSEFWDAPPDTQQRVFEAMRRAGARMLVGSIPDTCTAAAGWTKIPGTNTSYRFLDRETAATPFRASAP